VRVHHASADAHLDELRRKHERVPFLLADRSMGLPDRASREVQELRVGLATLDQEVVFGDPGEFRHRP
jgi:hypothetical protein